MEQFKKENLEKIKEFTYKVLDGDIILRNGNPIGAERLSTVKSCFEVWYYLSDYETTSPEVDEFLSDLCARAQISKHHYEEFVDYMIKDI